MLRSRRILINPLFRSALVSSRPFSTKPKSRLLESCRPGLLTLKDLEKKVDKGEIDTVCLVFPDHLGRLMGKRYDADFFLDTADEGTHACSYLLTVDMENTTRPGFEYASWESGYGDFHMVPDFETLKVASWMDKAAIVTCDIHNADTHELVEIAPRSMLKKQVRLANENNLSVSAASELEFFVYNTSYKDAWKTGYKDLEPNGWAMEDYHILQGARHEPLMAAVRRHLKKSGIPVENSKGEYGLGQHELNVRYDNVLPMSDNHFLYKQCMKEVADSMGLSVTFMAKVNQDESGSSCHMHVSLWDEKQSRNLFQGNQTLGSVEGCSDEFKWFLGGWMARMEETAVMYAPTINSYKRFQDGSWAPTSIAWSKDNRTAGFRVVGSGSSLRIECRIPGADCNPYLGFAAAIASGLDGIKNRIEPPPMLSGDAYSTSDLTSIPPTLKLATDKFNNSDFAKAAFGPEVVHHYCTHFNHEVNDYRKAVTDWERKRYFEQI